MENDTLARIPDEEFAKLQPYLEFQQLLALRVLNDPSRPVTHLYFLNSGLASLVVPTSEGRSIEVGVVGKGGFAGIPFLCGIRRTLVSTIIQVPGDAWRIHADDLERVLPTVPKLRANMQCYALLQGMQVAQTAACNRLHELEQRLARWLLVACDRVGPRLEITQEHLAAILGTGRASLNVVASRIRKAGIIAYTRGVLRILNPDRLEGFSCECYAAVRQYRAELGLSF